MEECFDKKMIGMLLCVVSSLVLIKKAYAYIDPRTGSMIVQAVIAAVAVVSASIVVFRRQVASFLGRLFSREKQSVDILINDRKVREWVITEGGFQEKTILIPEDSFTNPDYVVITFKISDPRSPAELGISSDGRRLGIGLRTLVLDESTT